MWNVPSLGKLIYLDNSGLQIVNFFQTIRRENAKKTLMNVLILAKNAGYTEYVTFKNRKIEKLIKL